MSLPPAHRPFLSAHPQVMGLILALLAPLAALALGPPAGSSAQAAPAPAKAAGSGSGNPLLGHRWGVYQGAADQVWEPWTRATGRHRQLLGKIATQPKAQWFGRWIPNADIGDKVTRYIDSATGGDPDVLVQMAVFRMDPWEAQACKQLPTAQQKASYKNWIDRFSRSVGATHTALILQPDGPFALCAPHGSQSPSHLIAYAARTFAALPHTSVYIDAGAADWLRADPHKALKILLPAGIRGVRGFALDSTHYSSTADEVAFGTKVVSALAARGVPGKHFVVNTAENGRPFPGYTYRGKNFDNARVCASKKDSRCVTLGIPPTSDVANSKWGQSAQTNARAAAHVDGYLWFGRPWLYEQADPFDLQRALAVARTTPY